MHLFLFLALPSATVAYCFAAYQKPARFFAPAAIGATLGAILCIVKEFFVFSPPPHQALFSLQLLWAAEEFSLPVLAASLLWQLFSRGDMDFKGKAFFPLLAFLCAPLIVREAFATVEANSSFMLFLHPALSLCALLLFCSCVMFSRQLAFKKHIALCVLPLCVAAATAFVPPVLQTLWTLKIAGNLYLYLSLVFILLSLIVFFTQQKTQRENEDDLPTTENVSLAQDDLISENVDTSSSHWGWDMKAQESPIVTATVSSDGEFKADDSSQKKPVLHQQARIRGAHQAKRGRRARRGKNIYKRRRKR